MDKLSTSMVVVAVSSIALFRGRSVVDRPKGPGKEAATAAEQPGKGHRFAEVDVSSFHATGSVLAARRRCLGPERDTICSTRTQCSPRSSHASTPARKLPLR